MKQFRQFSNLLFVILILGCSSIKTSFDYDRQADFSAFKTYQLAEGIADLPLNDLNKQRVVSALNTQMQAKGFTESADPDVLIDVQITAQQKQTATATTTGMGGAGMGRRGWGMGGGMSTTHVNYDDYTVGTLFVSMADAKKKELVWQGRGEKTISEGASAEKREKNINNAMAKIFSKYPPQ